VKETYHRGEGLARISAASSNEELIAAFVVTRSRSPASNIDRRVDDSTWYIIYRLCNLSVLVPEEGATIEKQVGENRDQICRLARQSITIVVYDWGDTVFHHGREVRFGERELTC